MTDRTCSTCKHRHQANAGLECRAMPPAVGDGRLGRWPGVRPGDFCHGGYREEETAPAAPGAVQRARRARGEGDAELPL